LESVASAFSYPAEKLKALDKTEEVSEKYGNAIVSATLFQSDDDSFSPIQVLVTREGFLLNKELRTKLDQQQGDIKRLDFADGSVAYTGSQGFGKGGEGHISLAHLVGPKLDLQIRLVISYGTPLTEMPETARYREVLFTGASIHEALKHVASLSVSNLGNVVLPVQEERQKINQEQSSSSEGVISEVIQPSKADVTFPSWSTRNSKTLEPTDNSIALICIAVGVGILLLAFVVLRLRLKKR